MFFFVKNSSSFWLLSPTHFSLNWVSRFFFWVPCFAAQEFVWMQELPRFGYLYHEFDRFIRNFNWGNTPKSRLSMALWKSQKLWPKIYIYPRVASTP